MPRGKSSPKLAIPVDPEAHALVLTAATRAGLRVSARMTKAAREALVRRAGLAAVAAWEKQHGELTGEEAVVLAAADRNERQTWAETGAEDGDGTSGPFGTKWCLSASVTRMRLADC